jgi:hypothetical protein
MNKKILRYVFLGGIVSLVIQGCAHDRIPSLQTGDDLRKDWPLDILWAKNEVEYCLRTFDVAALALRSKGGIRFKARDINEIDLEKFSSVTSSLHENLSYLFPQFAIWRYKGALQNTNNVVITVFETETLTGGSATLALHWRVLAEDIVLDGLMFGGDVQHNRAPTYLSCNVAKWLLHEGDKVQGHSVKSE